MGGGRTAKKRSKAARRTSAAASRVAKAEQAELALQPEPEPAAAGFGALPLPRAMVTCDSSYRGTPELRVVTYNILAQTYFQSNPRQQATCPPGNRGQKARHTMLMDELDNLIGDVGGSGTGTAVICMQEVEASYLDMLLRPALESRGYTVLFLRKVGGKNPGDAYRQLEGIAIAWRGAAELVEHKEVDLDQAVLDAASLPGDGYLVAGGGSENLGWSEPTRTHHEACAAALPYRPGSVALIARIRNPATGAELAIGTVHIYWNWKRHDIQTLQARITADQLLEMAARSKVDCPTVLCGDFNAQPNSTLYTLLHRGSLSVCPLPYRAFLCVAVDAGIQRESNCTDRSDGATFAHSSHSTHWY
jgi:mRNA deadenylase 3'-5' endonuclease subunit Ccr4